ncbi:MAG: OmpA family protein [Saprospiraceae bacterium]
MTRKIFILLVLILGVSLYSFAQQAEDPNGGLLKLDAKPKHQSEIGIHAGHFMVIGDVLPKPSWGVGLHFRRALDYAWSIRIDATYGQAIGLEPRNSGTIATSQAAANYVLRDLGYGSGNAWYHNYKMKYYGLTVAGVWSLNSFNFKNQIKKTNWYILAGPGINFFETSYDAKGADDRAYDFNDVATGLEPGTSRADRREVRQNVKDILDGDYETRAEVAKGRRSGDSEEDESEMQINVHATVGTGLAYKINDRFNIALEHTVTMVFGNEGDLLDGYRWRTTQDLTQFKDLINYTSLRFNINIGKKSDERSEPLWWVSPLSLLGDDIASNKKRLDAIDLDDEDGDGVFDLVDQEPGTEEGCPVDTRGITLDSDGDGVPDCKDKEPYSLPNASVDAEGVAPPVELPTILSEGDVNKLIDAKMGAMQPSTIVNKVDWYLPMIHFNLNQYKIKAAEFGKLHNIAEVMRRNPDLRIVAAGHTDKLSGDCYNDVLSFNRAQAAIDYLVNKYNIDRSRFVLNYGGENANIVPTNGGSMINRRVEFKAYTNEQDMARPDCGVKRAGSGGTNYSGNKEGGY